MNWHIFVINLACTYGRQGSVNTLAIDIIIIVIRQKN